MISIMALASRTADHVIAAAAVPSTASTEGKALA
jgi:hypothetical protein